MNVSLSGHCTVGQYKSYGGFMGKSFPRSLINLYIGRFGYSQA